MNQAQIDLTIAKARSFIGTEWVLGGREPLVGIDCVGLVALSLTDAGFDVPTDSDYKIAGEFTKLTRFLLKISKKVGESWKDAQPGDILLFSVNEINNHVGIMSYDGNFIHVNSDEIYNMCLEEKLRGKWRMYVHSVYRVKDK